MATLQAQAHPGIARPWTFKVEFSRGCNLQCDFCPIHKLRHYNEDPRFMTPETCATITSQANRLNPTARVELTMRGEPTLNPDCLLLLNIIRTNMPKAQVSMFTNGVAILKDHNLMAHLLGSGVNILNIDCYNGTYERFERIAHEVFDGTDVALTDFREFSAYQRHPGGHRLCVVNLVPDIADPARLVRVRTIHNNAGNADEAKLRERWGIEPLTEPLAKKCARPFREMVFAYDGKVLLCRHDWKAEAVLGDAVRQGAEAVWYGMRHLVALRALYDGDRRSTPCNRCDYTGGFRLGLLRDPHMVES
jgi:MoaA/NifB/PqqE/SkfB family radical SAM enzyme